MPSETPVNSDLDYADKLWQAADKLRGTVDAAEYKHVVLGLLFLKYVSDSFESRRAQLKQELESDGISGAHLESLLESRDEYTAERVFWVPPDARWQNLQYQAARPEIATLIDDAILAVERDNPNLKNKLPRDYARRGIEPVKMKGLVELIADIGFKGTHRQARDTLGRVYEYFLGKFAEREGKLGGEFYTPRSVVRVLVEMLEPYEGRVYDPCCGSGGMFVQSEQFVEAHGGNTRDISIYGQESNPTTWRLAHMNLAIHTIEANLGIQPADTFLRDLYPDLKADYILANPPLNVSDWSGQLLEGDVRWRFGKPPNGNANYAWIQHFIHHLAVPNGLGGGVAMVISLMATCRQRPTLAASFTPFGSGVASESRPGGRRENTVSGNTVIFLASVRRPRRPRSRRTASSSLPAGMSEPRNRTLSHSPKSFRGWWQIWRSNSWTDSVSPRKFVSGFKRFVRRKNKYAT